MLIYALNERDDLILVTDSQDAKSVKEYLGEVAEKFDSFFVKVENGDYVEVYGFYGTIPWLDKVCKQILPMEGI